MFLGVLLDGWYRVTAQTLFSESGENLKNEWKKYTFLLEIDFF